MVLCTLRSALDVVQTTLDFVTGQKCQSKAATKARFCQYILTWARIKTILRDMCLKSCLFKFIEDTTVSPILEKKKKKT